MSEEGTINGFKYMSKEESIFSLISGMDICDLEEHLKSVNTCEVWYGCLKSLLRKGEIKKFKILLRFINSSVKILDLFEWSIKNEKYDIISHMITEKYFMRLYCSTQVRDGFNTLLFRGIHDLVETFIKHGYRCDAFPLTLFRDLLKYNTDDTMRSVYILIRAACLKNREIFGYKKILVKIFCQDSSNNIIKLMISDKEYDDVLRDALTPDMFDMAKMWYIENKKKEHRRFLSRAIKK